MALADEIRRVREQRRLTQQQAAEQVGVSERTWQRWEKGEIPEPVTLLVRWLGREA